MKAHKSQILHLCGKPGTGKSVLTKTVLEQICQTDNRSEITSVLYYFCNNRKRPEESVSNFLRAFIYQFLRKRKDIFRRLVERCSVLECWDSSSPEEFEFTFEILWEIIVSMFNVSGVKKFYCFIDALDECGRESVKGFLGLLPKFLKAVHGPTVKLFISSRMDPIIQNEVALCSESPCSIQLNANVTSGDIDSVLKERLTKLSRHLILTEEEQKALRKEFVNRSDGMFLWALLAMSELEKTRGLTMQSLKTTIDTLPSGLAPLYDSILRDLAKDCRNEAELSLVWRIISWVVRAARPMTLSELRAAIALDWQDTCFEETKHRMIRNIEYEVQRIPFLEIANHTVRSDDFSQLLSPKEIKDDAPQVSTVPPSTVRLIHQSAKEYLLNYLDHPEDIEHRNELRLPKFGHADMAGLCVTFLKFNDFDGGPVRGRRDSIATLSEILKKQIESYDLLGYAANFWDYHLKQVEPSEKLMALVCSFVCDAHNHVRFWYQVDKFMESGQFTGYIDGYFGLHVVAAKGVASVVKYLIKRGDDINKLDSLGRTPFFIADMRGSTEVKKLLTEAGANIPTGTWGLSDLSDLRVAALSADHDILRDLLNKDVDLNTVDEHGRTIVFYGCASGDPLVLTMILNAGASLVVQDRFGRTPLDVAIGQEVRQLIVERMRSMGIDCDIIQALRCRRTQRKNYLTYWCDSCGRVLSCYFYRWLAPPLRSSAPLLITDEDCCACPLDDYDICLECWDSGKRCLDEKHNLSLRVIDGGMVSCVEYSPWIADMSFASPILTPSIQLLQGQPQTQQLPSQSQEEVSRYKFPRISMRRAWSLMKEGAVWHKFRQRLRELRAGPID